MSNREIIERDGLYFRDYLTSKTALTNLNLLYDAERNDSDSIFFQSQSEPEFAHTLSFHSYQTKPQLSERVFDVTIFSNSSSTQNDLFNMVIDNQLLDSQNPQLMNGPSQTEHTSNSESIDEDTVSDEESGDSSEFVCGRERKDKKIKKSELKKTNKKLDREKNIFPNIAKRTAKIIFQDCRVLTEKYFQKRNIKFGDFEKEYKSLMDSNCSGLALSKYFSEKEGNEQMSQCFMKLFEKYLRKRYMVLAMRRGKMEDLETYIGCKNRQLMYFSKYMNSNFQGRV